MAWSRAPIEDTRVTDSVLKVVECCEELGRYSQLTSAGEFYGPRFATVVVCPPPRICFTR